MVTRGAELISIFQLVSAPEKYHSKSIIVSGFFKWAPTEGALYPTSEALKNGMSESAVAVVFVQSDELHRIEKWDGMVIQVSGLMPRSVDPFA